MSFYSRLFGLFNVNPFAIFFCLSLLRATCSTLVASSQHLVEVNQTFHALCHYERTDVDRFLYWTIHYYHDGHEYHNNFGGIDLSNLSLFSFDASNAVLAINTSLWGLTGHIGCDLDTETMRLYIHKVRPEYNGLRFSCTSGRKGSTQSNRVTLLVGKLRLVTLEIEDTGGENHTEDGGIALRATCRVDRSLNPKFLFWATREIDDAKTKSTFGGMILDFCFRYKVRGLFHRKIDFNCRGPPDFVSTLKVRSLPVGTAIFCYTVTDSKEGNVLRTESNWLAISKRGRFTKISLSSRSPFVSINGTFYAKCRLSSNSGLNDCHDRIRWRGLLKFGKRAQISCSKEQESVLMIKPIKTSDNKSQIFCYILGEAEKQIEELVIKVTRKVPISLEILRNESTINQVPINGTFQAVCSFRNIDVQTVVWVATMDNVEVGRVSISHNICSTRTLIKGPSITDRVNISCDLDAKRTTLIIHPVTGLDAGTGFYCATTDSYNLTLRSDFLTIKTQTAHVSKIIKLRPAYKKATLAASCPFGNSTEHIIFIHSVGKNNNGSDSLRTENGTFFANFIQLNKNCSVIDHSLYLPQRFFVGCDPENETLILIIDPVYGNVSDDFLITCVGYILLPYAYNSSASMRKLLLKTHRSPQLVYPVSKPALVYSGSKIVVNRSEPDIWNSVWLIPVVADQEMEFSCSAGSSKSSSFNLSLYIQTNEGYIFRLHDAEKKPNDTTETFSIKAMFHMKESYYGIFCAAENIVSRWESDFARIMLRNTSAFMSLRGWMASNSSFFMRHQTPNLKMCYKLCEVYSDCQGVSYHHKLCSLSNSGLQNLELEPKQNVTFYQRFQPEDILQRNDFQPDIYIKHENLTISPLGTFNTFKGITITECKKRCSELLLCHSILFHKGQKKCHLSRLKSLEKGTDRYDWDTYTKNNTHGSFVIVRNVLPDTNYHATIAMLTLSQSGNYEHQLMHCADACRNRDDCVSFVCAVKEENNSTVCLLYSVNIIGAHLVKPERSRSKSSFYVRVRSINSELVLVHRSTVPSIA